MTFRTPPHDNGPHCVIGKRDARKSFNSALLCDLNDVTWRDVTYVSPADEQGCINASIYLFRL